MSSPYNAARYALDYARSLAEPDAYWDEVASEFEWMSPWEKVKNASFEGDVSIRWFEGATLNITANCLDRHVRQRPTKPAILWEGDDATEQRSISFAELHQEVCRAANALKALGVKKGDRITIYMPMVPEAAIAMLACARIGAIHSVVFGGFAPDSIRSRILDCESDFIITANEGRRGGKTVPLKANVDVAIEGLAIRHVLVLARTQTLVSMQSDRDVWWHDIVPQQEPVCEPEPMDAEDPLFILYTSGSTGKPKGLLHTCGGYMVYAAHTHKLVFDMQEDDVYWCTADVGWITGHSYIVYGPLANGATTLMFEGVPNYPDASRFWQVVDRHKVTKFYTAPTAIRALMAQGDGYVQATSRASLKILGSVGEPINPSAWEWYAQVVGNGQAKVVDTYWQTETGGHIITPLPHAHEAKPGSAMFPFFGIKPEMYDIHGARLEGACEGMLCIAESWPGQARSIWGDHARFKLTYFTQVVGKYFTGDGAKRDADGCYWITGRVDDVINVSGHRLGTAEIEAAMNAHESVAETAVVGFPHEIKGQAIYAFVVLKAGVAGHAALEAALKQWIRERIGGLAVPEHLQLAHGLPKTRSGKIMRRILRKIAENEPENLGDITTLLNPEQVAQLVAERKNQGK